MSVVQMWARALLVLFLLEISIGICFADECLGRDDGYVCSGLTSYALCEDGTRTGEEKECDFDFVCAEGTSSIFKGNDTIDADRGSLPFYASILPACQEGYCDDIRGAVLSEYAQSIMPHCWDVTYERDVFYGKHKWWLDLIRTGGYPSMVELDSRRDPEDHDHKNNFCKLPESFCLGCCGGAKRQEEFLVSEYNITSAGDCDAITHVMACSKKFPGCKYDDEASFARNACEGWKFMCLSRPVDFDCGVWLAAGRSLKPALVFGLAMIFSL